MVLIHGSGMNARSWVRQLNALAGRLRLAALDLPGHGESDPAPRTSVEDYAGAVCDFIAALKSGPALVVGHSLGGAVAIALAARRPELVRGLVLIATCVKLPLVDSVGERLVAYLPAPLRRLVFFTMVQKVLFGPESPADAVAITMQALEAFNTLVQRFPDSKYARDAKLKMDLTNDHLAGKQMEIGRYYLNRGETNAAINRFRAVVKDYQTTTHVPEALHRLVECYLSLGLYTEAERVAAVLGYNYPGSKWYQDTYNIIDPSRRKEVFENRSFTDKAIDSLFRAD